MSSNEIVKPKKIMARSKNHKSFLSVVMKKYHLFKAYLLSQKFSVIKTYRVLPSDLYFYDGMSCMLYD